MNCQHGWWHRLRVRVAYAVMPRCTRDAVLHISYQYKIGQLLGEYVTGPLHVKDQAAKGLKDLGVNIVGESDA